MTFNENTLPGPIKTQVYAPMQFKVGSLDQRTGRECTILEGGTLDNAAKEDAPEMHLVVQVPPMRLLGGYVENTEGQPLQPQIQVRYDRYKSDRVECDKRGSFLTYRLPEEPFLLEFTLEDHQAVVLEQDRDFDINDRSIHVVMKEGPYPDDVSVWTAVTGKPDTEEAIGKTVQGENIKRREEEYRRLASASAEREEQQRRAAGQPQPPPEPKAPSELEIMAVDTKGKPVPRIVVQRASALETYSSPLQLRRDNAVPARNAPKEVLTNDDGVYTVPNFSIVEANGVGRELVLIQKGEAYEEPMRVTLAPAASITVRVTDYDGKPQKDLVVVPAEDMWAMEGTDFYGAPRTTAKGEVRLDPLFPGDYTLAVRQPRQFKDGQAVKANLKPAYAFAHVDAGEHVTCEVIFGTPKPGSADAILDNWIAALKNRNKKPEDFPPESRSQRRAVAKLIVQRINATNQVLPQLRDEIRGMALVARALNDKDTVQPFKALLSSCGQECRMGVVVWRLAFRSREHDRRCCRQRLHRIPGGPCSEVERRPEDPSPSRDWSGSPRHPGERCRICASSRRRLRETECTRTQRQLHARRKNGGSRYHDTVRDSRLAPGPSRPTQQRPCGSGLRDRRDHCRQRVELWRDDVPDAPLRVGMARRGNT